MPRSAAVPHSGHLPEVLPWRSYAHLKHKPLRRRLKDLRRFRASQIGSQPRLSSIIHIGKPSMYVRAVPKAHPVPEARHCAQALSFTDPRSTALVHTK